MRLVLNLMSVKYTHTIVVSISPRGRVPSSHSIACLRRLPDILLNSNDMIL